MSTIWKGDKAKRETGSQDGKHIVETFVQKNDTSFSVHEIKSNQILLDPTLSLRWFAKFIFFSSFCWIANNRVKCMILNTLCPYKQF